MSGKPISFASARAKRGQIRNVAFTIDVAANHGRMTVYQGATAEDALALAELADVWARCLRTVARRIRKGLA